jgi:hypothetical protein
MRFSVDSSVEIFDPFRQGRTIRTARKNAKCKLNFLASLVCKEIVRVTSDGKGCCLLEKI